MVEPAEDVHALAGDIRVLIAQLRRTMSAQADTGDFTPSQVTVLRMLESTGSATVTALARAEGVRPQSMGATVSSLEAMGVVRRERDPLDGRQSLVSLSPDFLAHMLASRAIRIDWLANALAERLDAAERAEVASAVRSLTRLVSG